MLVVLMLFQAITALIFPLGRMALAYAGPFFVVGVRQLVAGLFLLLFVALFKR